MTDIIKTSASAIESFDDSTPFGCERKWYFKSVMKLPEPARENLLLGTNLHKAVEEFLTHGTPTSEMSSEVRRLFSAIKPEAIRVREEGFLALEHPIDFMLVPDVRIIGRIDVLRKNGPLDWKTSSDLKYAPTPFKLSRSTQMLVYSAWQDVASSGPGDQIGIPTQVTHVYVQTKGRPLTQRIDAPMNNSLLTEGVERVINIARRMKAAAKLPTADDLKPDRSKCKAGTKLECPYLAVCPVEKSTMSLAIDRLKARLNPTAASAKAPLAAPAFAGERESDRAATAVLDAVKARQVLPADAPKPKAFERRLEIQQEPSENLATQVAQQVVEQAAPKPEVNADAPHTTPAETTPIIPPKRGPGRPPGAKNKPKAAVEPEPMKLVEATVLTTVPASDPRPAAPAPEKQAEHYTARSVTVSMTGKLNMGHYQSLDIHVSQTMEYAGSPDEAFTRCAAIVKSQLDAALENVVGRKVEDPVPADVLASTKR